MKTGITNITVVPDLGSSPAVVNRKTGELFLNGRMWKDLPFNKRLFILLHEAGHATLNTTNEFEADAWAFEQYAKLGYSLKDAVKSLTQVLNFTNPEHIHRAKAQLHRALDFDQKNNTMSKSNSFVDPSGNVNFAQNGFIGNMLNKWQDNRHERKMTKIEGRNEAKLGRAESGNTFWNQAGGLAGQAIDAAGNVAKGYMQAKGDAASGGLGGLLGGGAAGKTGADGAEGKSKTWIWIAVAVAVVVLVIVLLLVFSKKKK